MSWFRSRSRLGAYLALLALAFQLAVTFAHVHLDHSTIGRAPAQAPDARMSVAMVAPAPAGSETPALADDCCAVCALIHLAGSLVTADTPPLPLPVRCRSQRTFAAACDLTEAPLTRFRARAPPVA
jgi:hypothetical protein